MPVRLNIIQERLLIAHRVLHDVMLFLLHVVFLITVLSREVVLVAVVLDYRVSESVAVQLVLLPASSNK